MPTLKLTHDEVRLLNDMFSCISDLGLFEGYDGSIEVNAEGGVGSYTYAWEKDSQTLDSESSNKLTVSSITSTNADFTSFLATDTTEGYILTEEDSPAGVQADRIVTQDGDFIDFENGTASRTIPSFITDGSTGTSNIAYEAGTVADSILLEDGTDTDRDQEFDHIVLETSLSSDRSITSVGSDQTLPTDAGAFNLEFETDADGIIDFSESNPFGEAT